MFRCVKYHPEALQKELKFLLISREQFFDAKGQMAVMGLTDIQRAARFYILIKESFGTDTRTFCVRPKNLDNAIAYITEVSKRLNNVVIENQDFERIFKTYDKSSALFYLDPPYYNSEKYYAEKFTPEDHIRLKHGLEEIEGRFILSYNDCDYIRELYHGYKIIEADRSNSLIKWGEKPRYREILIKNF